MKPTEHVGIRSANSSNKIKAWNILIEERAKKAQKGGKLPSPEITQDIPKKLPEPLPKPKTPEPVSKPKTPELKSPESSKIPVPSKSPVLPPKSPELSKSSSLPKTPEPSKTPSPVQIPSEPPKIPEFPKIPDVPKVIPKIPQKSPWDPQSTTETKLVEAPEFPGYKISVDDPYKKATAAMISRPISIPSPEPDSDNDDDDDEDEEVIADLEEENIDPEIIEEVDEEEEEEFFRKP
ncbi:hypothetical protein O3M35_009143 [Rhynocoris fuscipes]|uniref:Uncharacterized protein n=1 Tax=Rhynocoris fuscipes TaxID=488301 RepID=A0AAW1D332_9HEMI